MILGCILWLQQAVLGSILRWNILHRQFIIRLCIIHHSSSLRLIFLVHFKGLNLLPILDHNLKNHTKTTIPQCRFLHYFILLQILACLSDKLLFLGLLSFVSLPLQQAQLHDESNVLLCQDQSDLWLHLSSSHLLFFLAPLFVHLLFSTILLPFIVIVDTLLLPFKATSSMLLLLQLKLTASAVQLGHQQPLALTKVYMPQQQLLLLIVFASAGLIQVITCRVQVMLLILLIFVLHLLLLLLFMLP